MAQHSHETSGEGFPLLTDPVSKDSVPLFVENLLRGEKPRAEWMCGVEFELFGYDRRRAAAPTGRRRARAATLSGTPARSGREQPPHLPRRRLRPSAHNRGAALVPKDALRGDAPVPGRAGPARLGQDRKRVV